MEDKKKIGYFKKLAQIETSKIVTIVGICLMSCIILYSGITSADYFTEQNWTIDNDTGLVWFEDDRAFLSAFPHNITSSQWVYFNVTSKQFSGDVDAVWGFNGENAKPKSAELYKPHYINWTTEHSQFFQNVSVFNPLTESTEPCDFGNEYNTVNDKHFEITYQICIEHDENGCVDYDTTSSVVCSDSFEPSGQFVPNLNYTAHWTTNHSRLENWKDITDKFKRTETENSKTFLNISNNITTNEPCDYGNSYNPIHREITYQVCDEYEEMECVSYISNTSVVCFDSYEQNENDYTIFWKDISSKLDKINYDYQGMDSWYYLKNVSIQKDKNYQIRMWVDMPISLDGVNGKYFWAIKPTNMNLTTAKDKGYFYALDPWFNSSWTYKKNITINHSKVNGSQVNFPVLINITDTDLKDDAQADGDDIVFTDSDNSQLDHEIEFYNSTTGFLVAWVRIPTLSNTTDTVIQMYYGNADASNQENATGVWDDNFVMVQHLSETPTAYMNDSTSNNNDGTTSGMDSADQVAGQIDGSLDFDGVDDCVSTFNSDITSNFTASLWFKTSQIDSMDQLIGDYDDTAGDEGWTLRFSGNDIEFAHGGGGGFEQIPFVPVSNSDDGIWHYVAIAVSDTTIRWSYNSFEYSTDLLKVTADSQYNIVIGSSAKNVITKLFNGIIDEVRISNTVRSAGWIATEYNNQYSPDSFYSVGSEETGDDTYPQFSNYQDNNNTLTDSGTGLFNITVENTNGTVILEINGTNTTADNVSNVFNVSYVFSSAETYPYKWHSWGNGTNANYNVSIERNYVVNSSAIDTCTYTSGNWEVDCSDNCIITTNIDVGGNNISIIGTGTFKINGGNVSNYEELFIKGTDSNNICEVYCYGGCFI